MLSPLPTNSSMYRHKNCMMTINKQIQKVIRNLGRNLDSMNVYSFFIFGMDAKLITNGKITEKNGATTLAAPFFWFFSIVANPV